MELRRIQAARRNTERKGEARRLRRQESIPAIAYGKGLSPIPLTISPKTLESVLESERGRNTPLELEVDGEITVPVMITDYQYHPVSRAPMHVDFLQIKLDQEVEVEVPFELTGKAQGVQLGGTVYRVFRRLPVSCLPENIPTKITHDVTALELEEHVAVRDLTLPEGVRVRLPHGQTVAGVAGAKKEEETKEGGDEATPAATPEGAATST